jgi:DHA1 family bicyclomycin/chloramphenicol resistance-like MFS transporter
MVSAVNGVAPIIAPVLGGFLLNFMSWKGTFAVLLLYGALLLFMSGKFQESLPVKRRSKKSVFASFSLYVKVFKNRAYVSYFLVCTFPMIILFGYIASSPFIYQKIYGLSPVGFSLCFALNAVFTAIGCALSGKVGNEFKALKIAGTGMFVFAIAVAAALMTHAILPLLQVAFMGLTFMFGMSQPPANALALNAERANAGTAAAAIGASGFLMGGIVSPLVGMGDIATSVSIVLVVGSVLTLISVLAIGSLCAKGIVSHSK